MPDAMNCGKQVFTWLETVLPPLSKGFGDKIAAPNTQALDVFIAQMRGSLRRPMLLPASIF